jgi:hypothetical protein
VFDLKSTEMDSNSKPLDGLLARLLELHKQRSIVTTTRILSPFNIGRVHLNFVSSETE